MEGRSPDKLLLLYTFAVGVAALAVAFFTLLYQMISAKADVAGVRDPRQRRRLLISFWMITACLASVIVSAVLILKPLLPVMASSETGNKASSDSSPCPCAEGQGKNDSSVPPADSNKEQSRATIKAGKAGKDFSINSVQRDRSRFAVMGTFSGVANSVEEGVEVSIPNSSFFLAGSSSIGRVPRVITGVRVGLGSPSELAKIAAGKRGVADWSDTFPLNIDINPGGKELTPGPQIDVRIPVRSTAGISNKAIIIEIRNTRRGAFSPIYPGYAISKGTVRLN